MKLFLLIAVGLFTVIYGERVISGNDPVSAAFSQWVQLLQDSEENVLQKAPQLGKLKKEELVLQHSKALHDLPSEVDEFLHQLNDEGTTNIDNRIQVVHGTPCQEYKNSFCYALRRPVNVYLGSWRNEIQVALRFPTFFISHRLHLFALEWDDVNQVTRKKLITTWPSWHSNSTIIHLQTCSLERTDSSLSNTIEWNDLKQFSVECEQCRFDAAVLKDIIGVQGSIVPPIEGELIIMTSPCVQKRLVRRSIDEELIKECDSRRDSQPCCVERYNFNQGESRMEPLFVRPVVLSMNVCRGYCTDITSSVTERAAFINAIHTTISPQLRSFLLQQECCSPAKYKPLNVLYYDKHSKLQAKQLMNFTATMCGCH